MTLETPPPIPPTPTETPVSLAPSAKIARRQTKSAGRSSKRGMSRFAYIFAVVGSILWGMCVIAFAVGYKSMDWAFDYQPIQMVLLGLVSILPAILMGIIAHAFRQADALQDETRRSREATERLVGPVVLAAGETASLVDHLHNEIDRAVGVATQASEHLAHLRLTLAEESDRMSATVAEAERVTRLLAEGLGAERMEMGVLSAELEGRAASIAGAIQRQAKMVSEASDLAETQIREAESILAARAADLAAAAADAGEVGALASQQFQLTAEQLEDVSAKIAGRVDSLTLALSTERDQLSHAAQALMVDHELVSGQMKSQRELLIDAVAQARIGSQDLHVAASSGAEALRQLIAEAAAQVGALVETARAEQEELENQARSRLKLFGAAIAEERTAIDQTTRHALHGFLSAADEARRAVSNEIEQHREQTVGATKEAIEELGRAAEGARLSAAAHLEETRRLAETHVGKAREQLDQLGESAFMAAQRADEIFDSRLASARRLIDESARIVEDAGLKSAQKIEVGLNATREALAELEALMSEVDTRAGRMPAQARMSVEAGRDAVSKGVNDLTEAARRAAAETQVIDLAFQERVKRNYEMLNQSVRLMSEVAGSADQATLEARAPSLQPPPATPPPPDIARAMEEARAKALAAVTSAVEEKRRVAAGGAAPASVPVAARGGDDAPLDLSAAAARPKLRLTPTEQDQAVGAVFQSPSEPRRDSRPGASDSWSLRDLLNNMDDPQPPPGRPAGERLVLELHSLGIDSAALLPRSRVEDIARALNLGDLDAGRSHIRRLAPAATRRLARRLDAEPSVRSEAAKFVADFGDRLIDSLAREGAATDLLTTEEGRAFLLLDAAISQQG